MPSMDIDVDFEVFCAKCGGGLCNQSTVRTRRGREPAVEVEPCERCLDRAHDEGYQRGVVEATKENEAKLDELRKRIEYLESLEQEVA